MKIRERTKNEFDNSCMVSSFMSYKILVRKRLNYIIFAPIIIGGDEILLRSEVLQLNESNRKGKLSKWRKDAQKKKDPEKTSFLKAYTSVYASFPFFHQRNDATVIAVETQPLSPWTDLNYLPANRS